MNHKSNLPFILSETFCGILMAWKDPQSCRETPTKTLCLEPFPSTPQPCLSQENPVWNRLDWKVIKSQPNKGRNKLRSSMRTHRQVITCTHTHTCTENSTLIIPVSLRVDCCRIIMQSLRCVSCNYGNWF